MYIKIALLALVASTFANPAPKPQTNLDELAASLTSALGELPTSFDLSSELGGATSLLGALSDMPALPTSVFSVLATAIPSSVLTQSDFACNPTAASWYNNLPGDVKSALTSYASAVETWASKHHLTGATDYTGGVPACTGAVGGSGGNGGSSNTNAATTTGASATDSQTSQATGSTSGATGNAVSSTNSPGAAPRATAVIGSFVGAVGALGVMAML